MADAVGWAIRLAKRVEELHRLGVAHGSLSAECVLTEGTGCDTAGVLADVRQSPLVVAYHSPERHGGGGISEADDTWAIAVTLYAIATGHLPFPGETAAEVRQRIASGAPPPLHGYDVNNAGLQAFLDSFLQGDTSQRGTSVAGLRSALEKWPGARNLGPLPPLDEAEGDMFSGTLDVDAADVDEDDDDYYDDEEEGIETVMKDFSEVRAELERMRADKEAASAAASRAPRAVSGVAAAAAAARPAPAVGLGHRPAGVRPPFSPAMSARRIPAAQAAPTATPAPPPPAPAAQAPPAPAPEVAPAARRRDSGTPLEPPSFEADIEDEEGEEFDEELATIVMSGPAADEVAAAVKAATAGDAASGAPSRPLPAAGRPAVRPAAGQPAQPAAPTPAVADRAPDSAELRGPPALADLDFDDDEHATVAKPRMANPEATQMLGGAPDALFDVAPKPPAAPGMGGPAPAPQRALRRPDSEPPLGRPPAPGPAAAPAPRLPGPPLPPGGAPVRVVDPAPPRSSLPLPGSASKPPPAMQARPSGFEADLAASLLPPEAPPDRLRTWLAVASLLLALVLAVVGLLWLRRQGIVEIF